MAGPTHAVSNYIYPLDSWQVSVVHGEDLGDGLYHMGIDAGNELPAGTAVYAVADGIVREAQERTQFGLVVLIEHFPEDESSNVSLYGHLDPTDVRVIVGQAVKAGDIIGVLGDRSNNGGWNTHIHFGIHKAPYTGEWVYYGHVRDAALADDWYDPEVYIPEHLISDAWLPTVQLDLTDNAIVGHTADFTVTARDLGSRVKSVLYKVSNDQGLTWTTVGKTSDPVGDVPVQLPLYAYEDGSLLLKVTVRDYFENKFPLTVAVMKDPNRYTSPAFLAMKGGKSDAFVTQWSFGSTALQGFFPFSTNWSRGGDITLGDVLGSGTQQIIVGHGSPQHLGKVKIFDQQGQLSQQFVVEQFGSIRLATGDVTGDGIAEVVMTTGQRDVATIQALDPSGQIIWSIQPLGTSQMGSFDIASGNLDEDLADEIVAVTRVGNESSIVTKAFIIDQDGAVIAQFFPFKQDFTGGANVTIGDVTGDGQNDLIFGSESNKSGTVKIFDTAGKKIMPAFRPFGDTFIGAVDVSMASWDVTEDDVVEQELLVSQASAGQAWVKAYRLSAEPEVLLEKRVYEASFTGGTRIVGYR